jgi:Retroviral aspartyl protease
MELVHKCAKELHIIEVEGEMIEDQILNEKEPYEVEGHEDETKEEQLIILSSLVIGSTNKSLKYKGQISQIPICILFDTGATHSFINLVLVKELKIQMES